MKKRLINKFWMKLIFFLLHFCFIIILFVHSFFLLQFFPSILIRPPTPCLCCQRQLTSSSIVPYDAILFCPRHRVASSAPALLLASTAIKALPACCCCSPLLLLLLGLQATHSRGCICAGWNRTGERTQGSR